MTHLLSLHAWEARKTICSLNSSQAIPARQSVQTLGTRQTRLSRQTNTRQTSLSLLTREARSTYNTHQHIMVMLTALSHHISNEQIIYLVCHGEYVLPLKY